ncbi:MAG: hypothetical protein A2W93_12035 [Bacteroidetes bacterium GWF2_43_63]|nr:MAG: hypothetical protein A2W94_11605 [Bacteroidetes bacterium GWE2_42_42]OFY56355.1 MAG: hypothetical protein A2W93_12035 [Bacteroidetes bacterium GWF2_43_63]
MQTKYSTSTNIIRDQGRDLNYIPTPNAKRIVEQLKSDFHKGIRSFNIIGSYGTGKSSFLWALQQSLTGKKRHFSVDLLKNPRIKFLNFIGEYKSILTSFADYFDVSTTKHQTENILSEIYSHYRELGKNNPLLVIVIDEFGKYLEYASQNLPEKELYFIQQLSEFANNPDHNIILITTIHQNFDAYAFSLNITQKQEWTKVKGRFREITFNEPIEQLLFLASEHLVNPNLDEKTEKEIHNALNIAKKSKAFSFGSDFISDISNRLYPLDLISANILTISLQKYGQNERSLFSFLESTDHTGINKLDRRLNPFYNIACVYDYLIFNFYSYINSRYNPDYAAWAAIKNSIDAIERLFPDNISDYSKIIKTIGLLEITAMNGSDLGKEFLIKYASTCLGVRNSEELVNSLEHNKIILFRKYNKQYILFEGTDLDITTALIEAESKVTEISDVATMLKKHYQLPSIYAKAYSYLMGTPRLFEFRISQTPINEVPTDEVDGFINLIFNETLTIKEVKETSLNHEEAILYGFYRNSKTIKNQLFEIEKTRKVLEENEHDRVAKRELENILHHQKNLLNHYILHNLYSNSSDLTWIFKGTEVKISSKKDFNKYLSHICYQIYAKAPVFRNELVNKHKISSSIHTAKKGFYRALVDNWDKPDLGFESNKFPPEKTIFLTLLKENGITLYSDKINFVPAVSPDSTFKELWSFSIAFLESAKHTRRSISDFISPLTKQPFKLKQGLIDFWIASFLFIKRDDYALFGESGYIPYITDEVLELLVKCPDDYEIKTFDIEGVKLDIFNSYRVFLNQHSKDKIDNNTFIETIKPFLTFYRGLPEYSRNTKRLKKETLSIRTAIANAKDPEKTFFEDFPTAIGFSVSSIQNSKDVLQAYIVKLQDSIRELRTAFDELINRFEEFILNDFIGEKMPFEKYKIELQARYRKLKKHLCLPHQKTFIQRLDSDLDDRKAWLSSIAQVIIGKSIEIINDEDEFILKDRFSIMIRELDSLTNISKSDFNDGKEDVLGIELSSFVDGINKSLIRLPKTRRTEVAQIETVIKSKLSKDKTINIAALANILKELLRK